MFHNNYFQSIALHISVHGTIKKHINHIRVSCYGTMVIMKTVIVQQNISQSPAILNFKFLNIFVCQNIDDNWRYNVV